MTEILVGAVVLCVGYPIVKFIGEEAMLIICGVLAATAVFLCASWCVGEIILNTLRAVGL